MCGVYICWNSLVNGGRICSSFDGVYRSFFGGTGRGVVILGGLLEEF